MADKGLMSGTSGSLNKPQSNGQKNRQKTHLLPDIMGCLYKHIKDAQHH